MWCSDFTQLQESTATRTVSRLGLLTAAAVTGAVFMGVAAPAMAAEHAPAKASTTSVAEKAAPVAKDGKTPPTRSSKGDRPQIFAKSVWFAVYNRSGQTVKVHDANKDRTTAVVPGDRVYLSGSSFLGPDIEGSMKFENGITTNFWANNHDLWWPGVQFDDDNFDYSEYEAHTYTRRSLNHRVSGRRLGLRFLHGADQLLSR